MKELNIPRINETIYQETLPNGLTVFYYPKEDFEKNVRYFLDQLRVNRSKIHAIKQ